MISREAICKLFTILEVYPAFIDVLLAFGQKTNFEDDSFNGFCFQEGATSGNFGMSNASTKS